MKRFYFLSFIISTYGTISWNMQPPFASASPADEYYNQLVVNSLQQLHDADPTERAVGHGMVVKIALYYRYGTNVTQHLPHARSLLIQTASMNHNPKAQTVAHLSIGEMLLNGEGGLPNLDLAQSYLEEVAKQNHYLTARIRAQYFLAKLFLLRVTLQNQVEWAQQRARHMLNANAELLGSLQEESTPFSSPQFYPLEPLPGEMLFESEPFKWLIKQEKV